MKFLMLSQICSLIVDCPHETPVWRDEGIAVLRNFNLQNGAIDMSEGYYVDEKTYRKRTKRVVPREGDIIFSREAPIGNCGIIPRGFKCCLGQRLVLLRTDTNICTPEYLIAVLQSSYVKQQIEQVSKRGSIVSNFAIGDLKNLVIPVMENQQDIAYTYDVISQKIRNNNDICTDLDSMAKLLYEYWFVQFDFPNEEGKPYKSSGGKMVWNEELKREIPEGWQHAELRDCVQSINTGLNPRDNFVLNTGGKIKYLTVKNLTNTGAIEWEPCDLIDEKARTVVHKRSDIKVGDILFASIAPLGRCYLICSEPLDWDINESVFSIRTNKKRVNQIYMFSFLTSESFVRAADNKSTGSVFKGIRINDLLSMTIILPPSNVLDEYKQKTEDVFELKEEIMMQNRQLSSLREFLLPMLMNGQVKVN